MGFLDKVKAQATVLADKAQTSVQQGQTKLAEMQSGKQVDHLLRELGAYVFLSERNRNQPDSEARWPSSWASSTRSRRQGPGDHHPRPATRTGHGGRSQAVDPRATAVDPKAAPPPVPTADPTPPPPVATAEPSPAPGGSGPGPGSAIPRSGGGLPGE